MREFGWRWVLRWYGLIAAIFASLTLAFLFAVRNDGAPTIPAYPGAIGDYHQPSPIEAQLLSESFGGFRTRDSYATVSAYYAAALREQGWVNGWYRNPAGICYTVLIIENSGVYIHEGLVVTSVSFKLRQAFDSELGKTAPPGCR